MSLTNPNKVVTEERLSEFYGQILPYMGGMPDVLANKFSRGDLYSTDEKMVGVWVDGKPLYMKSFTFTTPSASQGNICDISSNANIEAIINYGGYVIWSTGERLPLPWISGSDYYLSCKLMDNRYVYLSQSGYGNKNGIAWIQYTKTTDSAISIGSDTDYSTTEKIVGTWLDGKPIYQKTNVLPSTSIGGQTWTDIPVSSDGWNNIIDCIAYNGNWSIRSIMAALQPTGNKVQIYNCRNSNITIDGITLQYTKTS